MGLQTEKRLVALGTERWRRENEQRENERAERSLMIRLKEAQRRGDVMELARLHRELGKVIKARLG